MLFIIPVGLIASLFRCMERPREPEYQVVPQGPQVSCTVLVSWVYPESFLKPLEVTVIFLTSSAALPSDMSLSHLHHEPFSPLSSSCGDVSSNSTVVCAMSPV